MNDNAPLEFEIIKYLKNLFSNELPLGITGIGDDCAVIDQGNGFSQILTTDMLTEGTHFVRERISPFDLGYKSLAVNLSDIASMGGKPQYALLSLGLTSDLTREWIHLFLEGFRELLEINNIYLIGGDTVEAKREICVSITIVGQVKNEYLKLRSGAKVGDIICATGVVGDSAAGLAIVLDKSKGAQNFSTQLLKKHNRPRPHLDEGLFLGQEKGVHALMDLSDGVAPDIVKILTQSECGAIINLDAMPLSEEFVLFCSKNNVDAADFACTGGEDYCLLLTVDKNQFRQISDRFRKRFGRPLSEIGLVTTSKVLEFRREAKLYTLKSEPFNHFTKS